MRKGTSTILVDVGTVVSSLCAVVLTGILITRNLSPGESLETISAVDVPDWEEYLEGGNVIGTPNAPVKIIEFGDYQCPACRSFHARVKAVLAKYPEDVALVYRHYPLDGHPLAYPAARAANCAAAQDRFAEYHTLLFESPGWVVDPKAAFIALARQAGIEDLTSFEDCVSQLDPVLEIERDLAAVDRLGSNATPTVLVNDRWLRPSPDSAELDEVVRKTIGR